MAPPVAAEEPPAQRDMTYLEDSPPDLPRQPKPAPAKTEPPAGPPVTQIISPSGIGSKEFVVGGSFGDVAGGTAQAVEPMQSSPDSAASPTPPVLGNPGASEGARAARSSELRESDSPQRTVDSHISPGSVGKAEGKSSAPASPTSEPDITARPESVSDKATHDDALGFGLYTDAIAQFLLNPRTEPPLTLSIEGDWGRGKSSFMLQLESALRRESGKLAVAARIALAEAARSSPDAAAGSPPHVPTAREEKALARARRRAEAAVRVAHFSAWQHDKDEALWASFALAFLKEIAPSNIVRATALKVWLNWKRFDLGRGWLELVKLFATIALWVAIVFLMVRAVFFPTLMPDALAVPSATRSPIEGWWIYLRWIVPVALSQKVVQIARRVKEPLRFELRKYVEAPSYRERVPFVRSFHEDFARLVETYVGPDGKAFVFVDDLDRCEVPKSAELLQALNMMIPESSRLIFILGIDRKKVAAGIAARYEKILPFVAEPEPNSTTKLPYDPARALEYGGEFLEKFVQLPFRLPRASARELAQLLDKLLGAKITTPSDAGTAPTRRREPTDIPEVREAMEMVAPALDFNPRRLKHFLNLFRLRHYIGEATGKLPHGGTGGGLTLPRLAKLVAIELRWLAFFDDVLASEGLLDSLEADDKSNNRATRWRGIRELVHLLAWGVERDATRFRVTKDDVRALFGIGGGGERPNTTSV